MTFLGIDIGYDRCGVSILEYSSKGNRTDILFAGSIVTDKKLPFQERLKVLHEDLFFIKNKYLPSYMSIERLFFNRKNSTFEKVCMSKGIAMVLFNDISILEVEPKRVKSTIVGDGNATKKDMKIILEKILKCSLDNVLDDTVDALCLAMYHVEHYKIEQMSSQKNVRIKA
jgi:crossover junction endodeoxyribonuclease RuvC